MSEVTLWRAVLHLAIEDACSEITVAGARSKTRSGLIQAKAREKREVLLRDRAREYLLGNSKGLREVCMLAEVDADAIRDRAKELQAAGWKLDQHRRLLPRRRTSEEIHGDRAA